jgi:sulfotransferase family protein
MVGTNWPSKAFFLVGAPRCGTTSLASALAQHPQVCFSQPKEPHFFSSMGEDEDLARVEVDYIRTFFPPDQLSREMLGEASPSYLYAPQAIRRIDRIFPDARFLVIVRNPLEMVPSYHARLLYILDEDVADFETAWRLQAQRANGRAIPSRCRDPRLLQYAEIGRVGARLADLVGHVGQARVKTIVFDDFKRAPVAVYRDVLDFLGLEEDARTELNRMNRSKAFRSRLLQRLLMKPPAVGRRLLVPKAGRPSHLSFAGQLRKRLRRANVVRRHWPAISMSMHQELVHCFRDDVELLGRLLNCDLTHWLTAGPAAELSSNPEPDCLSASPRDVSVIGPTAL